MEGVLRMEISKPYGILLNQSDLKLQRNYFIEMCKLQGINCLYYAPRPDKHWTNYGEIKSNYFEPELIGTIFNEHPNQYTMKKLGWVNELNEGASIISVPYDLHDLQVGALFLIPSAIDPKKGRLFRVHQLSTMMIVPASITCELVPEYEDTYSPALDENTHDSMTFLRREDE